MTELLKALYDAFYERPSEEALKIIDAKDRLTDDISFDSFIAGFRLGYQLTTEVGMYKGESESAV